MIASVKTGLRNDPSGAGEAAWTTVSAKTGVLHDPSGAGEAAWASVSVKTGGEKRKTRRGMQVKLARKLRANLCMCRGQRNRL